MLGGIQLLKAGAGIAGTGLIIAATLGFLAIAVGSDPFHDIFPLSGYAAWVEVGFGAPLRETVRQPVVPSR